MNTKLALEIGELLRKKGQEISAAESCTGGALAAALTAPAGASDYFKMSLVTYANEAKDALLGVPAAVLKKAGAVSRDVAIAMAVGLARRSGADWSVSITGIAGPSGGSSDKPLGLVYLCLAGPDGIRTVEKNFGDLGRDRVRENAVEAALQLIADALSGRSKPDHGA